MTSFVKDLQNVINSHSMENDSDTPDHILAGLIDDLLHAFGKAQRARDKWYGHKTLSHPEYGDVAGSGGSGDAPCSPHPGAPDGSLANGSWYDAVDSVKNLPLNPVKDSCCFVMEKGTHYLYISDELGWKQGSIRKLKT